MKTGIPFDLICLGIGVVLSWFGTLIFRKHPGLVATAIDVFLVFVLPYTSPFRLPGSQCGSLWSSCNPSAGTVGKGVAAVPPLHWIGAAIILVGVYGWCFFFARRRNA